MADAETAFQNAFAAGDIDAAKEALGDADDTFPWLEVAVSANDGHCYREAHCAIADLVLSDEVLAFRERVLADDLPAVSAMLAAKPSLVSTPLTAGRGIARAIHHWREIPLAERLLDAGADIEVETTLGETPLAMQLRFGSVDAVRFLLERGAQPDRARAVMPSATQRERIELLLAHGWDIAVGNSLLHDANHGHGKRVVTWLEFGVAPNSADENGRTALHLLAARGSGREAIRALVEAGADINARDTDGDTPLDLAKGVESDAAALELQTLGAEE